MKNKEDKNYPNIHNITLIPLKLNLQNNKSKFEITFDYDVKRDTETSVARELRKALNLSSKYDKLIAKEIKTLLKNKLFLTDIFLLMNKQKSKQYEK